MKSGPVLGPAALFVASTLAGVRFFALEALKELWREREIGIELLIINAAECEPYLTSDHRVMVEYPERVIQGIRIMMRALGVKRGVIGIERNNQRILNPDSGTVFEWDDVVWLVGDRKKIQQPIAPTTVIDMPHASMRL